MKAKHFFSAIIVSCGVMAFAQTGSVSAKAENTFSGQQRLIERNTVDVGIARLTSGSVDVKITNNGKTYYFSGSSNGSIGSFSFEGDYFDVEVTLHSTSPAFWRISGSANYNIQTPESLTTRVTMNEPGDPMKQGQIGVVFGPMY